MSVLNTITILAVLLMLFVILEAAYVISSISKCGNCLYKDYCEHHKSDKEFVAPCKSHNNQNIAINNNHGIYA
jgi:hypothetical protein